MIRFHFNAKKALECILWAIDQDPTRDMYRTLKVIYAADKFHLNTYGRPVTGDRYIAMERGTVPSGVYDMINKRDPLSLYTIGEEHYPFKRNGTKLEADRPPNLEEFSDSDLEALEFGFKEYRDLSFPEIERKNHLESGWVKTWEDAPNSEIDVALMIEDPEALSEIKENAPHIVI